MLSPQTCTVCSGTVGRKWETLASDMWYLAVTANFLALDDDERGSKCALIPVTGARYHFTLHVFFWLASH